MEKTFYYPNGNIIAALNHTSEIPLIQMAEVFLQPNQSLHNVRLISQVPALERLVIVVKINGRTVPKVGADVEEARKVADDVLRQVGLWASKSQTPKLTGNRFAIVDLVRSVANGNDVDLTFQVDVSTTIWYNEQSASLGHPYDLSTWKPEIERLENMLPEAAELIVTMSLTHGVLVDNTTKPEEDLDEEDVTNLASASMAMIKVLADGPDSLKGLESWMAAAREAFDLLEFQVNVVADSHD